MNERFFDLKKDRQDQIINGAMRVITENGYRHASTDEMVAAASISKGLLFHYFKSKKGTYQFLYEYGTRYMLIEMREAARRAGCDFFEMHRLLMKADAAVLRKYPTMPLFLYRADVEMNETGVEIPAELTRAVQSHRSELLAGAQRPPFLTKEDTDNISNILLYSRVGMMRDLLWKEYHSDPEPAESDSDSSGNSGSEAGTNAGNGHPAPLPLHEQYAADYSKYIHMMRRLNM